MFFLEDNFLLCLASTGLESHSLSSVEVELEEFVSLFSSEMEPSLFPDSEDSGFCLDSPIIKYIKYKYLIFYRF